MVIVSNSQHGSLFKNEIFEILKILKQNKTVKNISIKKNLPFKRGKVNQFYVPYLIELENGTVVALYGTTSMRADRLKTQEWDCYGVKSYNNAIVTILVVPNKLSPKEERNYANEISKRNDSRITYIDHIAKLNKLNSLLEKN